MPYKDPQKRREMARHYADVWNQRHPEKRKEAVKNWKYRNWDKHLAIAKRYRERHRDRVRLSMNASDAKRAGSEARIQAKKKWLKANVAKQREIQKTANKIRALRKARNGGWSNPEAWFGRCEMYGWKCAYCTNPLTESTVEIEHVIPLARGGTGWTSNLVPACRSCNAKKHAKRILPLKLRLFKESI